MDSYLADMNAYDDLMISSTSKTTEKDQQKEGIQPDRVWIFFNMTNSHRKMRPFHPGTQNKSATWSYLLQQLGHDFFGAPALPPTL